MLNGRCRLHGGLSTGPKSIEGKQIVSKNALKHGRFSKEVLDFERLVRQQVSLFDRNDVCDV